MKGAPPRELLSLCNAPTWPKLGEAVADVFSAHVCSMLAGWLGWRGFIASSENWKDLLQMLEKSWGKNWKTTWGKLDFLLVSKNISKIEGIWQSMQFGLQFKFLSEPCASRTILWKDVLPPQWPRSPSGPACTWRGASRSRGPTSSLRPRAPAQDCCVCQQRWPHTF